MQKPRCLVIILTLFSSATIAQIREPSYEEISRCFFIYGAIAEVGRDFQKPKLFQFGQPKVSWIIDYIQTNKNNVAFNYVFESNLKANKRAGIQILDSLPNIMNTRNKKLFVTVLNQAVACDRSLGFRTNALPMLE